MANRIVTGAHYGLIDWLAQRVTAVVMAIYILLAITLLLIFSPDDYSSWKTIFSNQWMRIVTLIFFLSLCWHAWIGVRNILMDYICIIDIFQPWNKANRKTIYLNEVNPLENTLS